MPVFQLPYRDFVFPHPLLAEPSGVIAVGGDLDPMRVLLAYRFGIFPWYHEDEPPVWWFPNPRCVLFPDRLKVARSMRPYFNQDKFTVTYDTDFEQVISACRTIARPGQPGTWIHREVVSAFRALYELGYAHSVEVWNPDGILAGGLYGLALGKIFFGESMFSHESNASKFGFISLVRKLEREGFILVDCQQETPHLRSLGADMIPGGVFYEYCWRNLNYPDKPGSWK